MSEQSQDPERQERDRLRAKYQENIGRLWTNRPDTCPICASEWWSIADPIETPIRNVTMEARLTGSVKAYVYVPITCNLCGYTIFFNSGILDIRDAEEVKSSGPLYGPESPLRHKPTS